MQMKEEKIVELSQFGTRKTQILKEHQPALLTIIGQILAQ